MSAPAFPRAALEALMLRAASDGRAAEVQALSDALDAFTDLARQVTISQHAATVTQLAHEWATARRERFTLPAPPLPTDDTCENPIPEGPEERGGPCYYTAPEPAVREDERARMCPPCKRRAEYDNAKWRAAAKLSGLAVRLERACLGPRPKKESPE